MLLEVTDENVSAAINSPNLVIIDFWSSWCRPCIMMNPVMKNLAAKYPDVTIGKINITENEATPHQYRVEAIPTILFFKEGKMIKRLLGYHTEAEMSQIIDGLK